MASTGTSQQKGSWFKSQFSPGLTVWSLPSGVSPRAGVGFPWVYWFPLLVDSGLCGPAIRCRPVRSEPRLWRDPIHEWAVFPLKPPTCERCVRQRSIKGPQIWDEYISQLESTLVMLMYDKSTLKDGERWRRRQKRKMTNYFSRVMTAQQMTFDKLGGI